MYTEERDFDYNDYLDEEESNKTRKPLFDWKYILKVILVIILICLIIFLVFQVKNKLSKRNNNSNTEVKETGLAISDNVNLVREASYTYFFGNNNLPTVEGESKSITVKQLIGEKLLVSVKDKDGITCGYNISNATLIKNTDNYELKILLDCMNENTEKTFYYDLNGKCLNCNGENYTPIDGKSDNPTEDEHDDSKTGTCSTTYSEWSTTRKTDSNLIEEKRVVVKGYKNDLVYGNWSEPTTNVLIGNDKLEVKSYVTMSTEASETCSDETTTRPEEKEGRTITSRDVTTSSTKQVCTGGGTYTKTLSKWDNQAISCKSYSIGNVVCTYESKKTCQDKTVYSTKTYYKYCDTKTTDVATTYYISRSIDSKVVYTDYMLEKNLPEGYKKLEGSELIQYRYRENCGK